MCGRLTNRQFLYSTTLQSLLMEGVATYRPPLLIPAVALLSTSFFFLAISPFPANLIPQGRTHYRANRHSNYRRPRQP